MKHTANCKITEKALPHYYSKHFSLGDTLWQIKTLNNNTTVNRENKNDRQQPFKKHLTGLHNDEDINYTLKYHCLANIPPDVQ